MRFVSCALWWRPSTCDVAREGEGERSREGKTERGEGRVSVAVGGGEDGQREDARFV